MISPSFVKLETPTLLIISSFYKTHIVGYVRRQSPDIQYVSNFVPSTLTISTTWT